MSLGINKGIGRWRVKNKGLWGVICWDGVWTAIPQTKSGIAGGTNNHNGEGIRIMEDILGGWGTHHGALGIRVGYGGILKGFLGASLLGDGPQRVGEMGSQSSAPAPPSR